MMKSVARRIGHPGDDGADDESQPGAKELHVKMSKKIAQLTKVIYHLNTKNEDHASEVQGLQKSYESEIDQILKDAYAKMTNYKDQVERQFDRSTLEKNLAEAEARRLQDAQASKAEAAAAEKRSRDREIAIQNAAIVKIESLKLVVKKAKVDFAARAKELQRAVQKGESDMGETMKEVRERCKAEVDEVVKKSNANFTSMLAERCREEDKLRVRLANERAIAIEQQRAEHDRAIRAERDEMGKVIAERDEQINGLQAQVRDLKDTMSSGFMSARAELEQVEARLVGEQAARQMDMKDANTRAHAAEEACAVLRRDLAQCRADLHGQTRNGVNSAQEIGALISTRDRLTEELGTREVQLAAKEEAERKSKARIQRLELRIQDLELAEASAKKRCLGLSAESVAISARLEEERKCSGELVKELEATRDRANNVDCDLQQARLTHGRLVETVKGEWEAERVLWSEAKRKVESDATARQSALQAQLDSTISAVDEARASNDALDKAHRALMQSKEAEWKEERIELEGLLAQTSRDRERGSNEQNAALERERRSRADELAHLARDRAEERAVADRQINEWRSLAEAEKAKRGSDARHAAEELVLAQQTFRRELEQSLEAARLEAQAKWEQERRRLQSDSGANIASINARARDQVGAAARHIQQLESELKNSHESIEMTRLKLEEEHAQATARAVELASVSASKEALEKDLAQANGRLVEATSDWERRIQQERGEARDRLNHLAKSGQDAIDMAIRRERDSRKIDLAEQLRRQQDDFERRIREQNMLHEGQLDTVVKQASANNDSAVERMKIVLEMKFDEERARHRAEITRLNSYHQTLIEQHMREVDQMDRTASEKAAISKKEVDEVHALLEGRKIELIRARTSIEQLQRDLVARNDSDLEARQQFQMSSARKDQDHQDELKVQMARYDQLLSDMDAELANVRKRMDEVEARFRNRESRREDVERIGDLERLTTQQQEMVDQTLSDMKLFKLELANREKNYNEMFGTSPKVGVMSVLKVGSNSSSSTPPGINSIRTSNALRQVGAARQQYIGKVTGRAAGRQGDFPPLEQRRASK